MKAPFCGFDGRCSRPSCQYRHRYGCLEKNRFGSKTFMKSRVKDDGNERNAKTPKNEDKL